ncbi:MAG TPA: ferritin-like domain-containing protein [Bryobacteraceae bacterium]|nr:ferritin-like domain-containing protein [Bryobacteraceae bacterium]
MDQETMQQLFVEQIRDLYDAEKQIVRALPKLAKAAESEELTEALNSHLEETKNHVSRLEKVFQLIGANAKGKPCKGMKGLLEEGNEAVEQEDEGQLRDLAIIAGCQKVEHYEMSAYGTVRTIAEQMDKQDVVQLLQETEDEEKEADEKLTEVATNIYEAADEGGEEGEEAEEETIVSTRRSGATGRATAKPATRKAGR